MSSLASGLKQLLKVIESPDSDVIEELKIFLKDFSLQEEEIKFLNKALFQLTAFGKSLPEKTDAVKSNLKNYLTELSRKYEKDEILVIDRTEEKLAFQKMQEKLLSDINTPVVRLTNLHKTYPGFELKLKDTDNSDTIIELKLGEITGVVGVNATGKTTLFKCLTGELQHTKGIIEFPYFEKKYGKLNWHLIRSRIAYVPQHLPEWKGSLKENLKYEAAIRGVKPEENELEYTYIINRLGLTPFIDRTWTELSGGYRLRFALAKALIWKPDLLVIDEPLAHLDIHSQVLVLNDLRALSRNLRYPISVLISSHHIYELERVADKILYLQEEETGEKTTRKSKLAYSGELHEIYDTRESNLFLLETATDSSAVKKALSSISGLNISFNGLEYQIESGIHTGEEEILTKLFESKIRFKYFRDISGSPARLFGEEKKKLSTDEHGC